MVNKIWMYCLIIISLGFMIPSYAVTELSTEVSVEQMSPVQAGITLFNAKKYSEAVIEWHKALQSKHYSNSPEVYLNLGLTEFHLKDYGSSLAHLRKAQSLSPLSLKIHKTINYVSNYIQEKEFYRVKNSPFMAILLIWIPKAVWIILFILPLVIGTVVGLRHSLHGISPRLFFKEYVIYLSLSLLPLIMLFLQNSLDQSVYVTLIGSKPSPIYTYPSSKSPELGAINVGDAFELLKVQPKSAKFDPKKWIAVSTADVPLGWVKSKNFIVHGGKIDPSLASN